MSKLMMLVAAKWRDFSATIAEEPEAAAAEDEAVDVSSSRPLRSSRSAASGREEPDIPDDDDVDDDDDLDKGRKKRNRKKPANTPTGNAGKKVLY